MSSGLKPGDVCEVIGACCERTRCCIGADCELVKYQPIESCVFECAGCRHREDVFWEVRCAVQVDGLRATYVPAVWLRKKPPKEDQDSEPRTDFTPADASRWAETHWHPSRAKEPA